MGPAYGRKMMTGVLKAKGIKMSEGLVGDTMKRVCPTSVDRRLTVTRSKMNPRVYRADYFGQKLHIDQNEK